MQDNPHHIQSAAQLAALYGPISEAAIKKELTYLHPLYQKLIAASPFFIMATNGKEGLDASPRGDPPGFVVIENEHTLLLPERRGNNRVDSLHNLIHDPRIGLLFMIPGMRESLRVNGRAIISIEPALLERFIVQGQPPKCVLIVKVEAVYFQCARAAQRAQLWQRASEPLLAGLPTPGELLSATSGGTVDGEKYDRNLPQRLLTTMY